MSAEIKLQEEQIHSKIIDLEELNKVLHEMISNKKNLQNGYKIFEHYMLQRNFHVGILKIIFSNMENKLLLRFSCTVLNIYIRKNWSVNYLITNEEKLVKNFFIKFYKKNNILYNLT
jgi:hypothetical protein